MAEPPAPYLAESESGAVSRRPPATLLLTEYLLKQLSLLAPHTQQASDLRTVYFDDSRRHRIVPGFRALEMYVMILKNQHKDPSATMSVLQQKGRTIASYDLPLGRAILSTSTSQQKSKLLVHLIALFRNHQPGELYQHFEQHYSTRYLPAFSQEQDQEQRTALKSIIDGFISSYRKQFQMKKVLVVYQQSFSGEVTPSTLSPFIKSVKDFLAQLKSLPGTPLPDAAYALEQDELVKPLLNRLSEVAFLRSLSEKIRSSDKHEFQDWKTFIELYKQMDDLIIKKIGKDFGDRETADFIKEARKNPREYGQQPLKWISLFDQLAQKISTDLTTVLAAQQILVGKIRTLQELIAQSFSLLSDNVLRELSRLLKIKEQKPALQLVQIATIAKTRKKQLEAELKGKRTQFKQMDSSVIDQEERVQSIFKTLMGELRLKENVDRIKSSSQKFASNVSSLGKYVSAFEVPNVDYRSKIMGPLLAFATGARVDQSSALKSAGHLKNTLGSYARIIPPEVNSLISQYSQLMSSFPVQEEKAERKQGGIPDGR